MTPHEKPYRFTLSCNACGAHAEIETDDLYPLAFTIKCNVCSNTAEDINERFPNVPAPVFTSANEYALNSTIAELTRQIVEYQRAIAGFRIAVATLPVSLLK